VLYKLISVLLRKCEPPSACWPWYRIDRVTAAPDLQIWVRGPGPYLLTSSFSPSFFSSAMTFYERLTRK